MKNITTGTYRSLMIFLISLCLISCNRGSQKIAEDTNHTIIQPIDSTDMTNNFYDNTETINLPVHDLIIEGEIANPGIVDFSQMPVRSVIVKETLLDSAGGDRFVGAYRYDGYSLFDILEKRILQKSNKEEFAPIIDLYVEILNAAGEKVVFSWGEIYYPNSLHRIIIATGVSRIVPSKTKELWPLPGTSKIVAANDLVTERNISDPVKITVRSIRKSFPVIKGMSPMYTADLKLFQADNEIPLLVKLNEKAVVTFNTIFYGRGRGIHSTSPFTGFMLKDLLSSSCPVNKPDLQGGMLCLVGKDGYRCAVSYSELFNRNDQQEFLLIKTKPGEDGGLYRIFPACDFFSDRAIKSLSEIHAGI